MTQQLDPKQVRGLKEELDTLDSMVKIKSIGANLNLDEDGELSATGGGGGGGVNLYSTLGSNIDGALTQKASTDLLVHAKPDGVNDLISNNKITLGYLPDSVLGQVVYGGGFVPSTAVATLTTNAQEKLGTSDATITLTNDTTAITGYEANEGIYYIATASGTFASISFETGDWLISIGTAWSKVDNTDAVTGVKGNEEVNYRIGNVNITAQNVGAVTSSSTVTTSANSIQTLNDKSSSVFYPVTKTGAVYNADGSETLDNTLNTKATISTSAGDANKVMMADGTKALVGTSNIDGGAVTTAKLDDGAVTTAKIASGAVTSSNIDFTTFTPLGLRAMLYISATGGQGSTPIAQDSQVEFSSTYLGAKSVSYEFDPTSCVALNSGTCNYTHVSGNKLLEVELYVSGNFNVLWLAPTNKNPLATGVTMAANRTMGAKNVAGFGGNYFKLYYDVSQMTPGDSFFVNPYFTVYGGTALFSNSGTESFMSVKVYGKD